MRIDVYRGDELAASFPVGAGPSYYGADGRRVRELVTAAHFSYDPFGGGLGYGGLRDESPTALLASVASAVHSQGFRVVPVGVFFPVSEPGTIY